MKHLMTAVIAVSALLLGAAETEITEIDKNFAVEKVGDKEVRYHNAIDNPPFELTGFPWRKKGERLLRVPERLMAEDSGVNKGVRFLAQHTAGGAVRFKTDSRYISVRADLTLAPSDGNNISRNGGCGIDLYRKQGENWRFIRVIGPSHAQLYKGKVEGMLLRPGKVAKKRMTEYVLNLPTYNGVRSLEIGLEPDAKVEAPTPRKVKKPILFYGSSITQGGCCSRPGNAFTVKLCRALDADLINLGFSGSGKGEPEMAKAIAELDLAVFVLDYDHNSPSFEHLQATHEPFFQIIRKAHPNLPIVILTSSIWPQRDAIIRATYEHARAAGDKHVYYMAGKEYFKHLQDPLEALVDTCHPSDWGFDLMTQKILPLLQQALQEAAVEKTAQSLK